MNGPAGESEMLAFAERLLGLLDQGQFTATYKYAVLLGLMDLCLEHTQRSGAPPATVTTHQLAEKVIAMYWPQTRPFGHEQQGMLRQNTGRRARILALIDDFRRRHAPDPSATMHRARLHASKAYARLCKDVEWKLVEMPLPRVQRVGNENQPFVYHIAWDEHITRSVFQDGAVFDNRICFIGAAAEFLVRLSGLLRPLIHRKWAAMVARLNTDRLEDAALEGFLFGADRRTLEPVRAPLLDLQSGLCFYCQRGITGDCEVDHFLPWSRHPDNGLDNLVIAHAACNRDKRDFLAAAEHVARWGERNDRHAHALTDIAADQRWERDAARTTAVIRGVYLRLPQGVRLWRLRSDFVPSNRDEIVAALSAA